MKNLLIIISILISTYGFGQASSGAEFKKVYKLPNGKDSVVTVNDTVAKLTNDTPLLTLNDLDKVLFELDSKLISKDYKLVYQSLQAAIIEAEKRRNKIKK